MDGGAQDPGRFIGPTQANAIYSNYLAPTLTSILGTTTPPAAAQSGAVTFSVSAGRFGGPTLDQPGGATGPATSFLVGGDPSDFTDQVADVLLYLPAGYGGNVTITESWDGPTPGSSAVTVPVVPYDNRSFLADLRSSAANEAPDYTTSLTPPPPPQAPAATGVRGGIDWTTLKPLQRGPLGVAPDPITNGTYWTVTTTGGKPIIVFSADPLAQQPAASTALPGYQDVTTNCHGYTLGATGVVRPDGTIMNFQIPQPGDVNTVLTAGYKPVSIDEAVAAVKGGTQTVYFVFYDDKGSPIHSAVNGPTQPLVTLTRGSGGRSLDGSTPVSSKNGDQDLRPNTTIGDLRAIYGDNIKIYLGKQRGSRR